jgi:hypothetical protein
MFKGTRVAKPLSPQSILCLLRDASVMLCSQPIQAFSWEMDYFVSLVAIGPDCHRSYCYGPRHEYRYLNLQSYSVSSFVACYINCNAIKRQNAGEGDSFRPFKDTVCCRGYMTSKETKLIMNCE